MFICIDYHVGMKMPQGNLPQRDGGEESEPTWLPKVGQTVDLNKLAVRKPEGWGKGLGERVDLLPLHSEDKNVAQVTEVGKPDAEGHRLIRVRYPETQNKAGYSLTKQFDKYGNLIGHNYFDE